MKIILSLLILCASCILGIQSVKAQGGSEVAGISSAETYNIIYPKAVPLPGDSATTKSAKRNPVISSSNFAGLWRGREDCALLSTPDAILNITSNGPNDVILVGFYASGEDIKGTMHGAVITIPHQEIMDMETKISIEGTLIVSPDLSMLSSKVTIKCNGLNDVCANSYTR